MHNDFTLFKRTYPNGTKVFFYHAYDEKGHRVGPWTTHSLNKTAARNYCNGLIRAGELIPNKNKVMTFAEFANGFWDKNSDYVKQQQSRGDITSDYIGKSAMMIDKQVVPFFGSTPLDKITDKDVDKWLMGFSHREVIEDGKKTVVRYQNTYANLVFSTLKIMLGEAVRRGLIPFNPCTKVRRLKNDKKNIEILTVGEVQAMFPEDYKTVWGNNDIAYVANRLASLTGMRIGEILGLKGEFVFDKFIHVCGQYRPFGYVPYTKNKEDRNIPLMPEMIALLRELMKANGNGFLFSLDGGATPVTANTIRYGFKKAMNAIGITNAEINRRGLKVHGWRHFLNTDLLEQGLTVEQVQSVTGHKSLEMTRLYGHIDPRQIDAVVKAQAKIAGKKKQPKENPQATGRGKKETEGLKLVKPTAQKTA